MHITHTIVSKISDRENTDPINLPPLYEAVDPERLQELVESSPNDTSVAKFTYYGYQINVTGDGKTTIGEEVQSGST
ncbi:HalOD1 output domain-containing protein [Natronosalvus rutilus]|uniref:Halobacterial output domain-containing protein n=1 Tax=Natronosalvus rutilus TaxID=2953753 RepID=A0A9E7NA42_9EURY|nr:HalOD1 output domain-containing protein [Natronosalvus rutilus]UTF53254.1 hypothetical protein NGM29_15995 [Natronosalvus rutilus]